MGTISALWVYIKVPIALFCPILFKGFLEAPNGISGPCIAADTTAGNCISRSYIAANTIAGNCTSGMSITVNGIAGN